MQSPKLTDGDLTLENNDLVLVEGTEEIAQCCEIILGTNQGEWFLNPGVGINFSQLNGKNISEDAVREEIRAGLRQESRIQTIDEIIVLLDSAKRESSVNFKATSTTGEVVTGGTG